MADETDADGIARVHVESRQKAYRGLMPDTLLERLDLGALAEKWRQEIRNGWGEAIVALEKEQIIGFSYIGRSRDEDADARVGEVQAIYVHPTNWRRGCGRVLLDESLSRLRARGFETVTLWVLARNTSACLFYQASGFVEDGAQQEHPKTGLVEVRYAKAMVGESV